MNPAGLALPAGVRLAGPSDWRQVGDLTADAFRDDPFNRWLHSGDVRSMRSLFCRMARYVYLKRGFSLLAERGGAAMWMPAGIDAELPGRAFASLAAGLLLRGGPARLRRVMDSGRAMDANKPAEPHVYLFTIGTAAGARGQGLGRALLAPVLAWCDRHSVPVYLENSNPANHGFYAAHGFSRTGVVRVREDAPPLEAMWREPGEAA